jgi:hypothetical protein
MNMDGQDGQDVVEKYSMRSNARRELAIYRSLIDAKRGGGVAPDAVGEE